MAKEYSHSAPGTVPDAGWRKSTFSAYNGDCVEVAEPGCGLIRVRDSKAGAYGPELSFTRAEWARFLTSLKG